MTRTGKIALCLLLGATFLAGFMLILPRPLLLQMLIKLEPRWLMIHAAFLICAFVALIRARRADLRCHARFLSRAGLIALLGVLVALLLAPRTHRIYFDEDIYGQMALSIATESRAGLIEAACGGAACSGVAEPESGNESGWHGISYLLNKEPSGFPFLVSLVWRAISLLELFSPIPLFEPDEAGCAANLFFFMTGIVGIAILARGLLPHASREHGALIAALLYALWPENLRWAVTGAVEITASAVAIWSLVLAREAGREGRSIESISAALMLALAVQQRPEGMLLLLPFLVVAGIKPWRSPAGRQAYTIAFTTFVVMIVPHIVHLAAMSGEDWGAQGPKFAREHILPNLKANLGYWIGGADVRTTPGHSTAWFTFACIGLAAQLVAARCRSCAIHGAHGASTRQVGSIRSVGNLEVRSTMRMLAGVAVWFLSFFGIFIPFYAGSYYYGADIRFSLLVVAPFLLISYIGIDAITARLANALRITTAQPVIAFFCAFALIVPGIMNLAHPTEEGKQARADHAATALFAKKLPAGSLVLSHTPSMWLQHNVAAAQVGYAQTHPKWLDASLKRGNVFYHAGYWDISVETDVVLRPERFLPQIQSVEIHRAESEGRWVFRLYQLK